MPDVTAFVAGATGYTGRAVVAVLRERGIPTVAHVRPGSASGDAWGERFARLGTTVDRTPWEAKAMRATIASHRPTHCFALLGTTRARATTEGIESPYEAIDYGLTKLLFDACVGAAVAPRFVYLSSMGAREQTRNPYLRVRGRFERELKASLLPHLIVQPAFITGSDRDESRPMERAASAVFDALLGTLAIVGVAGPRDRFGSLTGRELAEGMVALALAEPGGRAVADTAAIRAAVADATSARGPGRDVADPAATGPERSR